MKMWMHSLIHQIPTPRYRTIPAKWPEIKHGGEMGWKLLFSSRAIANQWSDSRY